MAHVYFLAHASADKPLVRQLHAALTRAGVSCFLDEVDVLPGDEWDLVFPQAQRASASTLVLVSPRYDAAYYLRDEVHAAIAQGRVPGSEHRIIPIYVDGRPDPMPYGLGLKQGLDLAALGMDELVARLVALAAKLPGGGAVSSPGAAGAAPVAPAPSAPGCDRRKLYEALCAIQKVGGMFEEILAFELPDAARYVSPAVASPAQRAGDLVQWASLQGGDTLDRLCDAARMRAPGLL